MKYYRYYQGGLSNIYFYDKDDGSFACAFVVKKCKEIIYYWVPIIIFYGIAVELKGDITQGTWDSINVVDVKTTDPSKKKHTYKCTSSVVLEMEIKDQDAGSVNISGTLTKSVKTVIYEKNVGANNINIFIFAIR